MLVLSRKENESVIISDAQIVMSVVEITGKNVVFQIETREERIPRIERTRGTSEQAELDSSAGVATSLVCQMGSQEEPTKASIVGEKDTQVSPGSIHDSTKVFRCSCEPHESIALSDEITVTVLYIHEAKVRIGIECPSHLNVHRGEVYSRLFRTVSTGNDSEPVRRDSRSAQEPVISNKDFSCWISLKINQHLERCPDTTIQSLADAVGVTAASISRWRLGQAAVAAVHRDRLLSVLGTNLDELACELNLEHFTLPDVKRRGAVRRQLYQRKPLELFGNVSGSTTTEIFQGGVEGSSLEETQASALSSPIFVRGKPSEKIMLAIGCEILVEIKIQTTDSNSVSFAIRSPRKVEVYRQEPASIF